MGELGRAVRLGRAKRGISRRQLAHESGISERYLAQVESGEGNPSVITLRAIAQAIGMPAAELLPQLQPADSERAKIAALITRMPDNELPALMQNIERQLNGAAAADDRAGRIALVGLRGAGKSTLGRKLAAELDCPFVEINKVIEQEYGAAISILIENSGVGAFRRYERAALERVIAENDRVVIATAGGIVANADTYALLLRRTHAVWLKASPQEHMTRVMRQGDFRPMERNREAMEDLKAILDARSADYSRAESQVDTAGQTAAQSLAKLQAVVKKLVQA
jgi:XRE family aerobic/anaerobic benzoate catabolism transcriptional regulator